MNNKEHGRKMVAPIVVTICVIIYYLLYATLLIHILPGIWGIVFGVIPIILSGVMIYVCIQRLDEIGRGEEDDLSKY
jgi:hypothetical protein